MSTAEGLPVVVGTGLTGLAVSRALSREGIGHLLLGPEPDSEGPCLGESLNLEGSLDIQDYFPELRDRYLIKTGVHAHLGAMRVCCDLDMRRGWASSLFYRALGYSVPDGFLHVDRNGYDRAAFELVREDPHCSYRPERVQGVEYDRAGDRVAELITDFGERVAPSFTFDATNHVRAVAKHLPVGVRTLGAGQRAVWGHWEHPAEPRPEDPLWHVTHIMRLDRKTDGLDGVAWFIPLRRRASMGLAVDADEEGHSDAELLHAARDAVQRRGIFPEDAFEGPDKVRSIPRYVHFLHERAYGNNWMLAGGTFCRMWFGSSSGVASSFAAANCAPRILEDPDKYGPRYEELLTRLTAPHEIFEWLRRVEPEGVDTNELEERAGVLVEQSVLRLALSIRLKRGLMRNAVGGLLGAAIDRKMFDPAGICVRAEGDEPASRAA